MVVPFSPGGGSDIFGRAMAKGIEEVRPGVNVTVENRPSGNGAVGYSYVFAREGDGHYLVPS
ncbi:MAG: tripartite tricarboxylate transporter substrate binding protein, partial [Streptomycetales bacterium]